MKSVKTLGADIELSPRSQEVFSHIKSYTEQTGENMSRFHIESAVLNLSAYGDGHEDFKGPHELRELYYTLAHLATNSLIGIESSGYSVSN